MYPKGYQLETLKNIYLTLMIIRKAIQSSIKREYQRLSQTTYQAQVNLMMIAKKNLTIKMLSIVSESLRTIISKPQKEEITG